MKTKLYSIFFILSVSVFFSCQMKSEKVNPKSQKIDFKYLNFEKFGNSSNLNLIFLEVTNKSTDTLYLSKKNIIVNVTKGNETLLDIKNKSIGQIIYDPLPENKPKIELENLQEKQTADLKTSFAQQVFKKNFKTNQSKSTEDYITQIIENNCLVVLPNSTINYGTIFNNQAFDKTCKVEISYDHNSIFTFFINEKGKRINIYDL